jgi:uncharacterized tellurite resistance protein B-like protein
MHAGTYTLSVRGNTVRERRTGCRTERHMGRSDGGCVPSILFADDADARSIERGSFSCPACGGERAYARVVVSRSAAFFGLRMPVGTWGEYIECAACLGTYRPEVLAYDAGPDVPRVMPEYQRALRHVLALLVITDGRIHETEIRTVQQVYEAVCGTCLTRAEVLAEMEAVAAAPTTAARYLAQVMGYLNDYGKEQVLRGAARVCSADEDLAESEIDMVRRLGAVMRLDRSRVEAVLAAAAA